MSSEPALVRDLAPPVREAYRCLVAKGALKYTDFDGKSLSHLKSLPEQSQLQVISHLESSRQQLNIARSKSGFLVNLCERARRGALDIRGFGVLDIFGPQLDSLARKSPQIAPLVSEREWLEKQAGQLVTVVVSENLAAQFPITATISDVKRWLTTATGLSRFSLAHPRLSVLRDERTLAFYNFQASEEVRAKPKQRGGRRVNKVE